MLKLKTLGVPIVLLSIISPSWCQPSNVHFVDVPLTATPVPAKVKVTVENINWVETISVCNISSAPIPLTNLEFDFNYKVPMPTNIWGQPWVAWSVSSQTGTAVVLKGGTPFTPPLDADPNCKNPLTIQFNADPSAPAPTGPFVFKAEGAAPTGNGTLNVTLASAPSSNLANPIVTVKGSDTSQSQQTVAWGKTWSLTNLIAGTYSITGSFIDNGSTYYAANPVSAEVTAQGVTNKTLNYQQLATGTVNITLNQAPTGQAALKFTGHNYVVDRTISTGSTVSLPPDTYTVTTTAKGYTVNITPNPLIVAANSNANLQVTYKANQQNSAGPFTTSNGQIVDKNNNPVTFKGVSWFGFNTGNHVVHGLWQSDFDTMLGQIKSLGFNAVRIPFQFDFVLDSSIKPSGITNSCNGAPCNLDVPQDSALNTFKWVVKKFTDNGIYVLIDDHYEDNLYVANQAQWVSGWKSIAQMFADNPMVGYDLYNEPDSHNLTWQGSTSGTAWETGIMSAASAIYNIDTSKLIFIEGTAQGSLGSNWGDGFATDDQTVAQQISNSKSLFTQLASQAYVNQIVISPHVYGPDGTNNQGPDHSNQSVAFAAWSQLHGYLFNNFSNINNTSKSGFCTSTGCHLYPIAVGEFGGKFDPADPYYAKDVATLTNLAAFLTRLGSGKPASPSWFYWDWNPNSGNTGGILKDDWKTIDCNKVKYLKNNLSLQPSSGICP